LNSKVSPGLTFLLLRETGIESSWDAIPIFIDSKQSKTQMSFCITQSSLRNKVNASTIQTFKYLIKGEAAKAASRRLLNQN
jgi:hypothetical protein